VIEAMQAEWVWVVMAAMQVEAHQVQPEVRESLSAFQ